MRGVKHTHFTRLLSALTHETGAAIAPQLAAAQHHRRLIEQELLGGVFLPFHAFEVQPPTLPRG
jgi:hypothetical protein